MFELGCGCLGFLSRFDCIRNWSSGMTDLLLLDWLAEKGYKKENLPRFSSEGLKIEEEKYDFVNLFQYLTRAQAAER